MLYWKFCVGHMYFMSYLNKRPALYGYNFNIGSISAAAKYESNCGMVGASDVADFHELILFSICV